jgi:hypothetical protein
MSIRTRSRSGRRSCSSAPRPYSPPPARSYTRFIHWTARRDTRLGHHDADDVIQRVFVKLLEDDCHRLRIWQGEVFEPFLRQVVHNKARRSPAHSFVRTTTRALGPRGARRWVVQFLA